MSLFLSIFVFAQEEIPSSEPEVVSTDYTTILASQPSVCDAYATEKFCEKHMIYDKGSEEIRVFLTDNRRKDDGGMDINEVMREPASYGGELINHSLHTSLKIEEGKKIQSVSAQFTKSGAITVQVTVDGKVLKRTIELAQ